MLFRSLKLRSAIKDVARSLTGTVSPEINKLAHQIQVAPQGVEDHDFVFGYENPGGWVSGSMETDTALQEYVSHYPQQWEIVQKLLGLVRQKSRHACLVGGSLILIEDGTYRPIEECDGLIVPTGQGASAKATLLKRGDRFVNEYVFDNGEKIECTPDHLILTDKGWMKIEQALNDEATVVSFL